MTTFATALCAAALLCCASAGLAADREPVCYWGGLLRDCATGCVEGYSTSRCDGLAIIVKHSRRHK